MGVYGVCPTTGMGMGSSEEWAVTGACPRRFARQILWRTYMKRVLQIVALIAAFALPALCQYGRLSGHDQHEFDEAYNKWVKDSRKNDRDDVAKDERKMQSIMQHNNIPSDVPYDRITTNGNANRDNRDQYDHDRQDQGRYNDRDRDDRGRYDNRGAYP